MISRRNFLRGVSAAAVVVASRGVNMPAVADGELTLVAPQPAWVPHGFVIPDGRTVSRTMYAELFKAIGTSFGAPGPTTFRLPNLGQMTDDRIAVLIASESGAVPAGTAIHHLKPETTA